MIGETISHYRIVGKLGQGGMGVIYKAEDTKLGRQVALKFLPPERVRDQDARERFVREAKAASALDHANICTIHQIDETEDGQVFIAMACYDGETLNDKIARGPLEAGEVVDIALQIGRGLQKAHQAGIIHRDVKPANVMVTSDGVVKLLDFGLAKLSGHDLSQSTTTIGTAAYMSPEQAGGDPVDQRTDIWSLGVVMYEMSTGRKPFTGENPVAVVRSILDDQPESLQSAGFLEDVVTKCLEKNREERYADAGALIGDLEKGALQDKSLPRIERSIVVLPFEDLSPGKDNAYFADGLTEEIIHDLAQVHDLRVISRTSSMAFKGSDKAVGDIARELKVQYVLEGSVRKAGNDLRITAQFIEAKTDSHLWSEKYKGNLADIFEIQETVSRKIVDKLKLKLTPAEDNKLRERPFTDVRAYEYYLRAREEIERFQEDRLELAFQNIEKAQELVGENELLCAAEGYAHYQTVNLGVDLDEKHLVKAEELVTRVFAMNPDSPYGYFVLGMVAYKRGKPQEAVKCFRKGLELDPNHAESMWPLCVMLCHGGRPGEAASVHSRLVLIDPLNPMTFMTGYLVLSYAGSLNESIEQLQQVVTNFPDHKLGDYYLAYLLASVERRDEAFEVLDRISRQPESFISMLAAMLRCALTGDLPGLNQLLTEPIEKWALQDETLSLWLAEYFGLLGDLETAFKWLENSINRGMLAYPFLAKQDPFLEPLRNDARFVRLMKKVKQQWENFDPMEPAC